jgi:hypothetical protein
MRNADIQLSFTKHSMTKIKTILLVATCALLSACNQVGRYQLFLYNAETRSTYKFDTWTGQVWGWDADKQTWFEWSK